MNFPPARHALRHAALAVLLCLAAGCGGSAPRQSAIDVADAWTRATPPGRSEAAVYFTLANKGDAPDRLVAVRTSSATAAGLHETKHGADGVMSMQPLDGVDLPAGGTVDFAPMGRHVMVTGLQQPLAEGQSLPLVLEFAHAPAVTVQVTVQPLVPTVPGTHDGAAPTGAHAHH